MKNQEVKTTKKNQEVNYTDLLSKVFKRQNGTAEQFAAFAKTLDRGNK